jgi:hypothetical protein
MSARAAAALAIAVRSAVIATPIAGSG